MNRRKYLATIPTGVSGLALAGCTDNNTENTEDTEDTEDPDNTDNTDIPTFELPRCSSSTSIKITRIDGHDAVIENTDVNQRAVRFAAYTDNEEYTDTDFIGENPITEYYVVNAGATLGVELPDSTLISGNEHIGLPIDRLEVQTASIDDDGYRGEWEEGGCINPDELDYDSEIHRLRDLGEVDRPNDDDSSTPTETGTQFVLRVAVARGGGTGPYDEGDFYVRFNIEMEELTKELDFEIELEKQSGDVVRKSKTTSSENFDITLEDVWDGDITRATIPTEFRESTYRLFINDEQVLEASCSDTSTGAYACQHSGTVDLE
ncbi:MAG: hypothetical protein ACI8TL_000364 [Natronomonas sp.]|jgi:hypothetical protein